MDDILISRQAVLGAIDAYKYLDGNDAIYRLKQWLNEQECVQPKMGRWIHDGSHWKNRWICSECGYKLIDVQTNYCPECGSYNGGDDNADSD